MKIGGMQPYFLPYIGYWQHMNSVDKFIVDGDLQFIKASWINRNRILLNVKDFFITIPLKSCSHRSDIRERFISDQYFDKDVCKFLRTISVAYGKAPYFNEAMPIIEKCFLFQEKNL